MAITIKAVLIRASDLQPGDLFSTAGPDYWNLALDKGSVGERVYIRTNAPVAGADDVDVIVYRIEIQHNT